MTGVQNEFTKSSAYMRDITKDTRQGAAKSKRGSLDAGRILQALAASDAGSLSLPLDNRISATTTAFAGAHMKKTLADAFNQAIGDVQQTRVDTAEFKLKTGKEEDKTKLDLYGRQADLKERQLALSGRRGLSDMDYNEGVASLGAARMGDKADQANRDYATGLATLPIYAGIGYLEKRDKDATDAKEAERSKERLKADRDMIQLTKEMRGMTKLGGTS